MTDEEMVEAAAQAAFDADREAVGLPPANVRDAEGREKTYLRYARAALLAIKPHLLARGREQAARLAAERAEAWDQYVGHPCVVTAKEEGEEIAARIRALKDPPGETPPGPFPICRVDACERPAFAETGKCYRHSAESPLPGEKP